MNKKLTVTDLKFDKRNANQGTPRGREALEKSLKKYGAGRSILIDKEGNVIAGNKTLQEAIKQGYQDVEIVQTDGKKIVAVQRMDLDLNDPKARELAYADNRVGQLDLDWDVDAIMQDFENGLDLSSFWTEEELESLQENKINSGDGNDEKDEYEEEDEEEDEEKELFETQGIYALREDAIFSSSSKYGIPDLREDMLCNSWPFDTWGGEEIFDTSTILYVYGCKKIPETNQGGYLGFYVDDHRFEQVWSDAVRMIEKFKSINFNGIITPDFSVWRNSPVACQIWNIYRARWVGRYWQEAGVKVIPSLNWSDENSFEFAFDGIPKNAPIVSCQCRTTRSKKGKEYFLQGINKSIEVLTPKNVLIYGGEEHQDWLMKNLHEGPNYIYLESFTHARTKYRKKGGEISENQE